MESNLSITTLVSVQQLKCQPSLNYQEGRNGSQKREETYEFVRLL